MTTLVTARNDVKNRITDTTGKFWTDAMLTGWINDALKDIARRMECLEAKLTATLTANDGEVNLQTDLSPSGKTIFRIHTVEFQVNANQIYTLEARNREEMAGLWTPNQAVGAAWPSVYTVWGIMGVDAKMYLYPIPSQAGTLNIWCYRLPAVVALDADVLEIPSGWENLIVLYCEYVALRRDSDPRWSDAKSMYEQEIESMLTMTRNHHDQANWVVQPAPSMMSWYGGGDW